MNLNFNLNRLSKSFLFSGLILLTFGLIVRLFLYDKDFSIDYNLNSEFHASFLYLLIGLLLLIFSGIYLTIDKKLKFKLKSQLGWIHFVTTVLFVLGLMSSPIISSIYEAYGLTDNYAVVDSVFSIYLRITTFGLFIGTIIFIINLFIGLIGLFK